MDRAGFQKAVVASSVLVLCLTGLGSLAESRDLCRGCVLPGDSGNWLFCNSEKCSLEPGTCLAADQELTVKCKPGYSLPNSFLSIGISCSGNEWTPEIPQCLDKAKSKKVCSPLKSDSVIPECIVDGKEVDCTKPMDPGTTAMYHCRPSHTEYPDLTQAGAYRRQLTCRQDGRWSNLLPECQPICGVSSKNAMITPLIIDGKDAPLGSFPWHVGIFHLLDDGRWDNVCGGSLITKKVVMTAVHCAPQPPAGVNDIRVGLGKYYRSWDKVEEYAVKREVSRISIPPEYTGASTGYTWNVALLFLKEIVTVNSFIMPVCMDLNLPFRDTHTSSGNVVGWGIKTVGGYPSETLRHDDLTVIDSEECRKQLPPRTQMFAIDKFCGTKSEGTAAGKGDSGGGLTVEVKGQHYIFGITSVKLNDSLILFTNISWLPHKTWIENELVRLT